MKSSHFKHIMLVALLAVVIVPISLTQVTINDNRRPQPDPVKVETPDNGGETTNKEGGNTTSSNDGQSANANKSSNTRSNNTAVNAANNNNYSDPKRIES